MLVAMVAMVAIVTLVVLKVLPWGPDALEDSEHAADPAMEAFYPCYS